MSHDTAPFRQKKVTAQASQGKELPAPQKIAQLEFAKVYKQFVGLVQFTLRSFRLPNEIEVEIIQEVFLRLHKLADHIEAQRASQYLVVTTRNLATDYLRRLKTRKTDAMGTLEVNETPLWESDPKRLMELRVVGEFVKAVENTPGGACFGLFYRDGMSIAEISEKLGETPGTITSRLSRLRRKFKKELARRLHDFEENCLI